MIRVARVGGDRVVEEDFSAARSFTCDTNSNLVLFRDGQARQPLIAFASGVWLSVEVLDG